MEFDLNLDLKYLESKLGILDELWARARTRARCSESKRGATFEPGYWVTAVKKGARIGGICEVLIDAEAEQVFPDSVSTGIDLSKHVYLMARSRAQGSVLQGLYDRPLESVQVKGTTQLVLDELENQTRYTSYARRLSNAYSGGVDFPGRVE